MSSNKNFISKFLVLAAKIRSYLASVSKSILKKQKLWKIY